MRTRSFGRNFLMTQENQLIIQHWTKKAELDLGWRQRSMKTKNFLEEDQKQRR